MDIKIIEKMVPIKFISFSETEEVEIDSIFGIYHSFEIEEELREYEINYVGNELAILLKYGYLKNWRGSRMANMYCRTDKFNELIEFLSTLIE